MNDNLKCLIFTYHNVFHSLLASFRLRKWRLLALVSSGCPRMLTLTCMLSFTSAFATQRRWVMIKTNFQPKIGLKQPNALTQRSQPSIWVEKTTQRFLECTFSLFSLVVFNKYLPFERHSLCVKVIIKWTRFVDLISSSIWVHFSLAM